MYPSHEVVCARPHTFERTSSNRVCVLLTIVENGNYFVLPKRQTKQKQFWSLDLMPSSLSTRNTILLYGWPSLWCHKWPTLVLESSTQLVDLVLFTCKLYSVDEGVARCLLTVDVVVVRWGRNMFVPSKKPINYQLDEILEISKWYKPSLRLPWSNISLDLF